MKATNLPDAGRRPWTAPTMRFVGTAGDLLRGGGGKVSDVVGDPGEANMCPKGGCGTYE